MSQILKSEPSPALSKSRKSEIRDYIKAGVAEQKTFPRLIFGMDATASRQPTWDLAAKLQADMFAEAAAVGGLSMQLVFYCGNDECRASKWFTSGAALTETMTKIMCRSGGTQINCILKHTLNQALTSISPIRALVFVGDCFEEEDKTAEIFDLATALGRQDLRAFMFQDQSEPPGLYFPQAKAAFQKIAELTGGIYARFDANSAAQLGRLLRGAAAYAAGKPDGLVELQKVAGLLASK